MNHSQIQLNVLLLSLIIVFIFFILSKCESFLSKRELRKNIYGFYDNDPDEDMNNDNTLLKYLDK